MIDMRLGRIHRLPAQRVQTDPPTAGRPVAVQFPTRSWRHVALGRFTISRRLRTAVTTLTLVSGVGLASAGPAVALPPPQSPAARAAVDRLPTTTPGRQLFSVWSAHWWQWALSVPVHTGNKVTYPLLTAGRTSCDQGQHGNVWFLGGNIGGKPATQITRRCTIPTGVTLFMPVYNEWYDNSNCDGLPRGTLTTAQLRRQLAHDVHIAQQMSGSIDGHGIPNLGNARYQSPVFSYTTPKDSMPNDLLCRPSGHTFHAQTVRGAVADGFYFAIAPLSAGTHTVHWRASTGKGKLLLDITYHLLVQQQSRPVAMAVQPLG